MPNFKNSWLRKPAPQRRPPFAWQQLTELVAEAMGVLIMWHECLNEYSNLLNGASFDPVRVTHQAATLAQERGIKVEVGKGVTVASFSYDGVEFMIAEYDHYNDGDEMKSFRLAVCRAILQQAEVMKS